MSAKHFDERTMKIIRKQRKFNSSEVTVFSCQEQEETKTQTKKTTNAVLRDTANMLSIVPRPQASRHMHRRYLISAHKDRENMAFTALIDINAQLIKLCSHLLYWI